MSKLTKITPYLPIAIAGIVVIVLVWIIYKYVINRNPIDKIKDDINKAQLSYDESQYYIYADRIENAFGGLWGDDEEEIYNVFAAMQTDSDVLMLIVAWGNRSFLFGMTTQMSLTDALYLQLNSDEITHINEILASNGITITF